MSPIEAAPPSERSRRALGLVAQLLALLALVFWRPLALGAPPLEVLACAAFLVAYVAAPGWFLWRLFHPAPSDVPTELGMAFTFGLALLMLALAAAAPLGWIEHIAWYPAVVVPLALAAARSAGGTIAWPSASDLSPLHWLALGVLAVVAGARTETYALGLVPDVSMADLLFHAGNAAEFRHHWPLSDPRIASEPLVYHFYAYGPPVAASVVTGIPTHELVLTYLGCLAPVLLGLQLFNVARLLGANASFGLVAAALVLLHLDVGTLLARLFGAVALESGFASHLDYGVYRSPTTALALLFGVAALPFIARALESGRALVPRTWLACALLATTLAGVKGSSVPPMVAACVLLGIGRTLRDRAFDRSSFALAAVLALAALPMTLHLVSDADGYAQRMFGWRPFHLVQVSLLTPVVLRHPGESSADPATLALALAFPVWLVAHLGATSIAYGARIACGGPWRALELWVLAALIAGLVPAMALEAPGVSQLFFVYPAHVALAVVVAVALALAWTSKRAAFRASAALAFGIWCAASVTAIATALPDEWRAARTGKPSTAVEAEDCRAVAAWLREETPIDSVLFARSGPILFSVLAERRVFFESAIFAPGRHAAREPGAAPLGRVAEWAERRSLAARALERPAPELFAEIRERLSDAGPLYVCQDLSSDARDLASEETGLELAFSNRSWRIFRVAQR